MNTPALTFKNTHFDVIDRNSQPWLRGLQIASALGYADEGKAIQKLFDRNSEEFTAAMTALVKVPCLNPQTDGAGQIREVRIFSLRGCHLLAMLSRTKIAKDFRKWVLDILDKEQNSCLTVNLKTPTGLQSITFKFNTEGYSNGRWFISLTDGTFQIKPIPDNEFCMSFDRWIKYATQERGYLVIKKSEIISKLQS